MLEYICLNILFNGEAGQVILFSPLVLRMYFVWLVWENCFDHWRAAAGTAMSVNLICHPILTVLTWVGFPWIDSQSNWVGGVDWESIWLSLGPQQELTAEISQILKYNLFPHAESNLRPILDWL